MHRLKHFRNADHVVGSEEFSARLICHGNRDCLGIKIDLESKKEIFYLLLLIRERVIETVSFLLAGTTQKW